MKKIRAITGTTKTKEIFDEQESKEFVKAVLKEPHQKKRTIFALLIFLGLRKAEICGLSWSDIDFYNKTLSVNHKIFMKLINEKLPSFLDYCIQTRNAQSLEEVIYIISVNQFDYKG